ncbi:MAG: oligoendopeptidase F [Bacillota bacterium]
MEKKGNLPERQDIPDQYKWKIEDIYAGEELWERDFLRVQEMLGKIETFRGKLGESADRLLEALKLESEIQELAEKIYTFARMKRDEDNTNDRFQALSGRAENLTTRVEEALSFIVPEILTIPEPRVHNFIKENPGLAGYSFVLEEVFRQKPHTLSPSEERIIAQAGEVSTAPSNIFRMINNADLIFPTITDDEGKETEVTHGRYGLFMESGNRRVRRDAFNSLYSTYRKFKNTFAATLGGGVKRDIFFARVRKFPSSLEAALFSDNISPEVYDNLIQTVRGSLGSLHRYMALRKRLLKVRELHMYDLYVPMVENVKWEIPYQDAVTLVKEGLAPLGGEYGRIIAEGLNSGWVDVYENRGKTSGAYSWGPYGVHPYILMNYQNNLNNVFTLAHEMGHAMHSFYSYREQPYHYAHYNIFTAEVASTVNESLLMNHLLATVTDQKKKLYLLNHYLEQFRGTVFRQTMFAEFEKIIHEKAEAGESLTPESLCAEYRRLVTDYHGPEVTVDNEIDLEWARIPHFYTAFYVYKYATGFSAATALTRQILDEGAPAVSRYTDFLKKGGHGYALDLLKEAGVDMTTPRPVQDGLDLFSQLLRQFEESI